ncbi:PIN domain-containing protein [Dyadobacter sp. CY261]|uniref:PIN domain-containing protein n=1 Tax=Dyadobacter sp. CY261 TaxID=2907203 RepID=UPI0038D459E6
MHIDTYNAIPLYEQHRDPFDRLILATAYAEKMPVVSADENFKYYKELISLVEINKARQLHITGLCLLSLYGFRLFAARSCAVS